MPWPPAPTPGFGLENLPFGVTSEGRVVVALGEVAIDLNALDGLDVARDVWASGSLNQFLELGRPAWVRTRAQLRDLLGQGSQPQEGACLDRKTLGMTLPIEVADYVDFYASEVHASAMGSILRPGTDPLPPAWKHLPIGYHGRSGTVVTSGADIPRPSGLTPGREGSPSFSPTRRLDVEVELGYLIGGSTTRGVPVDINHARDHLFGLTLLNDWSARDIQAFEYRPLGPMLGKSFATSIGPWVVTFDAIDRWRVDGPDQVPEPSPYLRQQEPRGVDIALQLSLNGTVVSTTSSSGLYWSPDQMLAHLTVNGASARSGDLLGSGTISMEGLDHAGSLMELTLNGTRSLRLDDGSTREWLEDGDTVEIAGWCGTAGENGSLSLGTVTGTVVKAAALKGPGGEGTE